MVKKLLLSVLFLFFLVGCSSTPKAEYNTEVSTPLTKYTFKIKDFSQYLEKQNVKPIYIYINKAVIRSSEKGKALPEHIVTLTQSALKNFGDKVEIITSFANYSKLKNNPRCYAIQGAITAYDSDIIVNSSSVNLFLNLSIDDKKNKDKGKYKNKNRTSRMIGDFMLEQNGVIVDKVSSKVMIHANQKGYRFGINLLGSTIGVSTYTQVEDGIEFSMRKLVEASMIDLMGKAFDIETWGMITVPEPTKNTLIDSHLSNKDFCSDVEKIVFYPMALKDERFNEFGMSYESEMNKLKCFEKLYTKSEQSQYKVRLNTVFGEFTNRSQSYSNAKFIQRKINIDLEISRKNLLTKSVESKQKCDKPDNHDYCEFIENRVELEKVWR